MLEKHFWIEYLLFWCPG